MKKTPLIVLATLVILAIGGAAFFVPQLGVRGEYNRLRDQLAAELVNGFATQSLDADRLREIEGEWTSRNREVGGPHTEALKLIGDEPTVANVVNLLAYQMPPYDWFDRDQNLDALTMGTIQATLTPVSTDHTVHVLPDGSAAVIYHQDGLASVFRDTDEGLMEELRVRDADPSGSE